MSTTDSTIRPLPFIIDSCDLISKLGQPPPDIIKGIFGRGSKGVLGGASKTNKTWLLADLGFCVAYGLPWMGMETVPGKVLLLNLELQDYFYGWRLSQISKARGIKLEPGRFKIWNLRGHSRSYEQFLDSLKPSIPQGEFSLIELDPIYKIL